MSVILGDTLTKDLTTHNPTTGQVQDADVIPTCQVFGGDVDIPILTPIVVKRVGQIGDYRVSFVVSAANGFAIGGSYDIIVSVTVAGITAKARIASFSVERETVISGPIRL